MKQTREVRIVEVTFVRRVECENHTVRLMAVPGDASPREVRRFIGNLIDEASDGPWKAASYINVAPCPNGVARQERGYGFELERDDLTVHLSSKVEWAGGDITVYQVIRGEDGQLRLTE